MKRFIHPNLSLAEMVKIINAYEEMRGATECESVFDLKDAHDVKFFDNLYGWQTRERCLKEARYWVGGINFYDNPANKCLGTEHQIYLLNQIKAESIIIALLPDLETMIVEYINDSSNKAKACSVLHDLFYDTIEIHEYYLSTLAPKKHEAFGREWTEVKEKFSLNKEIWWKVLAINGGEFWMNNLDGEILWIDSQGKWFIDNI